MKPQFFIVVGPNGAGKTTYVQEHVPAGTFIFNGDQVYADLIKRHPNYDPESLKGGVPQQMEKDINNALSVSANFGFETTYSSNLSIEVTQTFIDAGYETNMIYFGLDDIQSAALRVDHRVQLGGHDLSISDIRFNFEEGLKRVKENLHLYDTIKFADTGIYGIAPIIAYYLKEAGKHVVLNDTIRWFNNHFKEPLLNLAIEHINSEITHKRIKGIERDRGEDLDYGMGSPKTGR